MSEQQLNLFKFPAGRTAHFRATTPKVVWCDSGNASCHGVRPEQLPDDFLTHPQAVNLIAAMHRPEQLAVRSLRLHSPSVDGVLHPDRHWDRPNAVVLADQIHYAPAVVPLLDMSQFECGYLRSTQPATQEHREHSPVAQSLLRRDVRRIQ